MDHLQLTPQGPGAPITEADLHAHVDGQLSPARDAEVMMYLDAHPSELARVQAWQQQNEALHRLLDPVLHEAVPPHLPARIPALLQRRIQPVPWRGLAAGIAIAALSAGSSWWARGSVDAERVRLAYAEGARSTQEQVASTDEALHGFARRAAVAHVVYSPDVRRPVEVGADEEQALVSWLSKRLGSDVRPPLLKTVGYELIGGRLLPGDKGPVAQFMYNDAAGQRMTLYVTRETPAAADGSNTAFSFGRDGPVNVFYWVDKQFGYAISGGSDRKDLLRVAQEVHRQLAPR
jgi:anti-sigma factor RsiW